MINPAPKSRDSLHVRIAVLIHRALIQIRTLAQNGACEQIYELADAIELLPKNLDACNEDDLARVRAALEAYEAKFSGGAHGYVAILDMPEEEFSQVFGQNGPSF